MPDADGEGNECGTFFGCYDGCADDDSPEAQACVDACVDALSAAEYREVLDLDYCLRNSFCASDNFECQRLRCAPQASACFDDPSIVAPMDSARVSCDSYLQCENSCPAEPEADNQTCIATCTRVFAEGAQPAGALNLCIDGSRCVEQEAGANAGFYQCVLGNCQMEYDTCLPPGLPEGGVGACQEYFTCTSQCDDRLGPIGDCAADCRNRTRSASYATARLYIACVIDNQCNSIDDEGLRADCINNNCGERVRACINDGN
jgi:hypothetical protein